MTDRYGATNTPEPAAETPGASSAVSFDEHAVRIAKRQYFQPGDDDVMGMFRRVAKAVAAAEQPGQENAWEEAFFALMAAKRFCPGGRVLAGAGTEHGNLLNCFPAGTEVITPEGYVPIEEIQPGAEVVTRSGAIRRVERIKARDVTEEMVTVRVHGRAADALRGTAKHQVYAARGGADACELIPLGELRVGDALLTQVDRTVREPEPFDLLAAYGHNLDSVREEDGRIHPVTRAIREYNGDFDRPATAAPFRRVEVRPALARLAGLYLAEGCIIPTGVKWTVSRREEHLTEEIRRLICEVFGLPVRVCPAANQKHGWIDVYCNSALVREFFLENFGRYSHGKRLPLWAMQMPHHLQAALLSGVVAGDAYLGVRLRLVLANKQLVYQLYSLFQRLGIAGVSMLPANGKLSSKPTFSITSSSEEVTEAVKRLVATQQPPERPVISRSGQRLVNGEVANVVTAVECHTEETTVFNFSVEDEHNYVVNYLAVKNCFVQAATEHEPDSMQGIMEVAEKLALVTKVGGGNGVHLGLLREQGAQITGSGGSASGPVSFLRQIYAPILRVVRQGGTRRGAGMATLDVDHPDIFDFITCKDLEREQAEGRIETFNISVLASHAFMDAVRRDADWNLNSRVDGRVVRTVRAREIFDAIAEHAWATGEPGLIFIDTVNDFNPMRQALGDIKATNPCGEIVLYAGEPCDLGAINLAAFVTGRNQGLAGYDFAGLERTTQVAVRFLDDVLDVNRFAVEQNRQMSQALRRLGLGVMGLADALIEMGLPYDTEDGRAAVTAILERMRDAAVAASERLAGERGPFPWHDRAEGIPPRRNVAVLTVAPTGTTSMLFGVSSGVEPVFAPFIWRKIGDDFVPLLSPLFERVARERGLFSDELVRRIQANYGSVVGLGEVPEDVQRVFRCAHDVTPEDHVRMQAAVQNAFDGDGKMAMNSISKTINLPNGATVADVRKAYLLAYDLTCKGITVYRDGSRDLQVLSTSSSTGKAEAVPGRAWGDRLDLPRSLASVRESVRFPDLSGGGKLYVNVGFVEDEGVRRPVEVFLNTKGLGPELQGHLIGYGRLIGEVLRLGGSVENVEDALMGIQGVGLLQDQGDIVRSLPEAIALGIRRAVRQEVAPVSNAPATGHAGDGRGGNGHSQHAAATAGASPVAEATGLRCPECGSEGLRREEGCYKCDVCGYSKCG